MKNFIPNSFEDIVVNRYYNYSRYVNREKMLPDPLDGLLPVQRRTLLTLHQVAKNHFVKTAKIVGDCVAKYHPHALNQGTCEWTVQNGFADGDGNWGSRLGTEDIEAASMRYTEIKANKFIEDMAFKYVDYVEWIDGELVDKEPKTLPTMFPFCLFAKNELSMIGFGFKTEIPVFKLEDLKKRLLYLKGIIKKEPIIKPVINGCNILSNDKEIKKILTIGVGQIDVCGKFVVDNLNKIIYINGWSSRTKFDTLFEKIKKYLGQDDIGYIDNSSGKNGTCIKFEVSKQRNVGVIFDKMKDVIEKCLKTSLSYRMYIGSREENVRLMSVDEMLLKAYDNYKEAQTNYYKINIKILKEKEKELDIILKIKPHISSLNTNDDFNISLKKMSKLSGVKEEDIKTVVEKYRIKTLLTMNIDVSEVQNIINEMKTNLNKVDEIVLNDYQNLKV